MPAHPPRTTLETTLRALLTAALILVSAPAVAQDGGVDDAGAPPVPAVCGALSDEGACFGDVAAWCASENSAGEAPAADVESLDCATRGGACLDDVPDVGAWCAVPSGASCATGGAGRVIQLGCGTTAVDPDLVCDVEEGCRAGTATCPVDAPVCVDDGLALSCSAFGQALVVRCPEGCAGGICPDRPVGALCDDAHLTCASGLACLAATAGGPGGRCVDDDAAAAVDAGPDTREPFGPSGGCRCVDEGGPVPVAALVSTLALLARRRPRARRR